ncbi:hypothetical protein Pelo_11260 [Pelomyxa schiedti]|nr:hypothetical protein Pelo_11260 [Pelomyxa schiedti]
MMATRHKKESVKLRFKVTLVSATNLPEGTQACLSWKRGGKGENAGVTKTVPAGKNGIAEWNHSVIILSTLFKNATGYEEKYMTISICEDKGRRKSTMGKTKINLAEYGNLAGSSESRILQVPKKLSRHTTYTLNIKIVSESLGIAGDDEQTDVHCVDDPPSDDEGKSIDFAQYDDNNPTPSPETTTTSSASATAFGDPNGSQGSTGSSSITATNSITASGSIHSSANTPSISTASAPSALAMHLASSTTSTDSSSDQTVVKELRALVLSLTSERDELKEQLSKSKSMKHSMRNETKYKQELAEKKKEVSSLQEQLDLVTKDRDKLIKAQSALMLEIQERSGDVQILSKMRNQMEEAAKDREILQDKLRKAAAKKTTNKEVLVSVEQQLAQKEQEIEELKKRHEVELTRASAEVKAAQAKEEILRRQAQSSEEMQSLREKIVQLEAQVKDLEVKNQESEECVQSLVRQREELKKQREELKQQLKLPSAINVSPSTGSPSASQSESALVRMAEQELAEAKSEIERLTKKLAEARVNIDEKSKSFQADLKKLREENDNLRKARVQSAATPMTTVLEAEVKKLRDENESLKRTKSPGVAASPLRSSNTVKKPVSPKLSESDSNSVSNEVLQWQLQVSDMIYRVFYNVDNPNFGASNVPLCAVSVLDKLLDRDCYETPDEYFFRAISAAVETTNRVHSTNKVMSLYWLTNTWHLVQGVHDKLTGDQQTIPEVEKLFILQSADCEPEEPRVKFLYHLQHSLFAQYIQALQKIQKALQPLVIHSFLESETAVLGKLSPSPLRRLKSEVETITGILSEFLESAIAARVPDSVCLQFFCQVLFWINTLVFNHLVSHPDICTCSTGFQLRLSLCRLDDFVSSHGSIRKSRVFLNHCVQAANLLVIDKSVVLDPAVRGTILSALSLPQVAALVLAFKADSNFPGTVVTEDVIAEMKKAQAAATESILLDAAEFIVPQF